MLTAKGELKLVDLGIAKRVDEDQDLTQTGQAVGTPHYISPEQIKGIKVDVRADIYSLGATLYHLVTGRPPYKGTSAALVMTMHLTEPLPDPRLYKPELSEGLCRVLRKMMAKDREQRYTDVYALDRDLYLLQTGQMPEPKEPTDSAIQTAVHPSAARSAPSSTPPPVPTSPPLTKTPSAAMTPAALSMPGVAVSGRPGTPEHAAATPAPASSATLFREEDLHFVEAELARHIGPVARVLVKRAAKTSPNLVALAAALVDNIPDEEGRRAFRSAVRARAK
jgi:serine/threonine-protein kinase